MSEATGEGLLELDRDVAVWLHVVADRHYGGDVQQAMNDSLAALMLAERDPAVGAWTSIEHLAKFRAAAKEQRS